MPVKNTIAALRLQFETEAAKEKLAEANKELRRANLKAKRASLKMTDLCNEVDLDDEKSMAALWPQIKTAHENLVEANKELRSAKLKADHASSKVTDLCAVVQKGLGSLVMST